MTLNVWGLPFGISADKSRRIEAIGRAIASSNYDVICLQELWMKTDFNTIKSYVKHSHPYHHYFYSGIIGSGLCIFSKWIIEETYYYAFPINGFFHMVHHGDWFGGKGIGFAIINIQGLNVIVYNTHLHANYSEEEGKDGYFAHRLVQALDTGLFIRHTSRSADIAVLAADLNCVPADLCSRLIQGLANLRDAAQIAQKREAAPETNEALRNSYRSKQTSSLSPGFRIDYILFKANSQVSISECIFPLGERIPGSNISYSDHEAIAATFQIIELNSADDNSSRGTKVNEMAEYLAEDLESSLEVCRLEIVAYERDIQSFGSFIILLCVAMILAPFIIDSHNIIKALFLLSAGVISFLLVLIVTRWQDIAWIKNAKKRMKLYTKTMDYKSSQY